MNCNPTWWTATKAAPERDPLDALNTLADCLRHGSPVPEPAASLLLDGLLRFMAGTRFEQAMGLQSAENGKRTAVQTAAHDWRNRQIRALAGLLQGDSAKAKAEAIAALLSTPRPQSCGIQEADMIVNELHLRRQFSLDMPTSVRQIQRILAAP